MTQAVLTLPSLVGRRSSRPSSSAAASTIGSASDAMVRALSLIGRAASPAVPAPPVQVTAAPTIHCASDAMVRGAELIGRFPGAVAPGQRRR